MKKLLFICLIALFPAFLNAQDVVSELINKYKGNDGITTIEINKNLFNLISINKSKDDEDDFLANNINKIRIITSEENKDINFYDYIMKSVDHSIYKELMLVKDGDEDVKILAKDKGGKISELLIVTNDADESAVISILGDINLKKIKGLGNSINIDGIEYLNEIDED